MSVRPCANRSTGKEVNMRNRFDRQLVQLNNELIEMGGMIEKAISDTVKALVNQDIELASNVIEYDEEIDHQEREIEQLCLKLLLQQQPVAKDLRLISAALKMITDMERIGDHATDISEITIELSKESYIKKLDHIQQMAKETMVMLVQSVEAFVNKDMDKARAVIAHDDVVDDLFNKVKAELIAIIAKTIISRVHPPCIKCHILEASKIQQKLISHVIIAENIILACKHRNSMVALLLTKQKQTVIGFSIDEIHTLHQIFQIFKLCTAWMVHCILPKLTHTISSPLIEIIVKLHN